MRKKTIAICIGDIDLTNGLRAIDDTGFILQVESEVENWTPGCNTIVADFSLPKRWKYRIMDAEGTLVADGVTPALRLFKSMALSQSMMDLIASAAGPKGSAREKRMVPLFAGDHYPAENDGIPKHFYLYSQIRFSDDSAIFIRTSDPMTPSEIGERWIHPAIELHGKNFQFLNNHQCYYKKCFNGTEIEIKFTITSTAHLWEMTVAAYQKIKDGELKGFIPEYGDEFQKWDYMNFMYEIVQPEGQEGYISFIPTTDGKYHIKRKWFKQDQMERLETITKSVQITGDFGDYLDAKLGIMASPLPAFRRVRYDVNFESLETGHVYGIFFDESSIPQMPGKVLKQCEIEYLRSRTVVEPDPGAVAREMNLISEWAFRFLEASGCNFTRGFYSKLSFLRDTVSEIAVSR